MSARPLYLSLQIPQADKWREQYNPLRWLTSAMISAWMHEQQLGIVSNITWFYRFIERRHPLLSMLVDRRTTAIEKLSWDIKVRSDDECVALGFTPADAKQQQDELRSRYDNLDNLREAVSFLALASFRGYAHLEKHYDNDGQENHLEPVWQWNWSRSGLYGEWFYNQGGQPVPGPAPGQDPNSLLKPIDSSTFVIREVERPIDEAVAQEFYRQGMCDKDWDAWLETFGIPPIFIELPENAAVDNQAEYQRVVDEIIANVRGTLPPGAKVHTVEVGTGTAPFETRSRYSDEKIVLKATGGLLTSLAQSGSGTLAGGAHQDSFDSLAEAEARLISEILQQQFDKPILDEKFPELPKLAWFELAAKESKDTAQVVDDVSGLASAGLEVDAAQVQELTGYRVTVRPPVDATAVTAAKGDEDIAPTENRARLDAILNRVDERQLRALIQSLGEQIDDATDGSWAPITNRVQALLDSPDDQFIANAKQLVADVPDLLKATDLDEPAIAAWQNSFSAALLNGLTQDAGKAPKNGGHGRNHANRGSKAPTARLQRIATRSEKARNPQKI